MKILLAIILAAACAQPGPVPLTDALDDISGPACDRIERCWPADYNEKFGDRPTCQSFVRSSCEGCPPTIAQDQVEDCAEWLASAPCDTTEPGPCDWGN